MYTHVYMCMCILSGIFLGHESFVLFSTLQSVFLIPLLSKYFCNYFWIIIEQ